MSAFNREGKLALARKLIPPDEFERVMSFEIKDLGFGYDQFGMEKEASILAYAFARYLHEYWFRVESEGVGNIPLHGPALIVSNHSGTLPIDAAMTAVDIFRCMDQPRPLRAIVDNFAGFLPFVNVFFYRCGQVIGHRRNFQDLLNAGELVGVWPEGTKGLGKPFSQRYNLSRFSVGFMELSLTYRAPIVPTALVGAEEQMPMIANLKPLARLLGFPYFPVTPLFPWLGPLGMVPLPSKYHLYYGEPIRYYEEYGPETVNYPETIRMLADKVQLTIQDMINKGLEERTSVFGLGEA
ncbi:MAG: acyltransferase family protein [Myxococcales bacterium]|nr:acyltransferase family protein [Myxococcales bacterium]